jgi:small subunit ribosomal protein S9
MSESTLTLGSEAHSQAPAKAPRPLRAPATPDKGGFVWGTGRRKTAVARVRVKPGKGQFVVSSTNVRDKAYDAFFTEPQHQLACRKPLEATKTLGKLDIHVNVRGGGITGQAEAVLLGVARALVAYDPALEQTLRDEGYLSRDSRKVERKKPGQPGARRRFQFSKR